MPFIAGTFHFYYGDTISVAYRSFSTLQWIKTFVAVSTFAYFLAIFVRKKIVVTIYKCRISQPYLFTRLILARLINASIAV